MNQPTAAAYLVFNGEASADLPEKYAKILRSAEPIHLPWPVDVVPPVGALINLDGLSGSFCEVIVDDVSYNYCEQHLTIRIGVHSNMNVDGSWGVLGLTSAAKEGCVSNDAITESLAEMFVEAGLSQ